jgi:hypothetical protein
MQEAGDDIQSIHKHSMHNNIPKIRSLEMSSFINLAFIILRASEQTAIF